MSYRSSLTVHPVLVATMLLALLGPLLTSCSRTEQTKEPLLNTSSPPPIDQAQYANVETATFSLG